MTPNIYKKDFHLKLKTFPWNPGQFLQNDGYLDIYAFLTGGFIQPDQDFEELPWDDDLLKEAT